MRILVHAPGITGQDEAMQLFKGPPGIMHEPMSEPIQQFRVSRGVTHQTKVVRCAHKAVAKMLLPDTVDDHARSQRVDGTNEPLAQAKSSVRGVLVRLWK